MMDDDDDDDDDDDERQCSYKRKNELSSPSHCCHGKEIRVIYSEYMCV